MLRSIKELQPDHSKHHVFWTKNEYKKHQERKFRQYAGFIIKQVPLDNHKYLHHALEPPEKPYRDEMKGILELCEDRDSYDHTENPYWAMEATMAYYVGREVASPNDKEHCRSIRFNLAQQIGILAHEHTFEDPITREGRLVIPQVMRVDK